MNRQQRIDYEVLDCAINGAWGGHDYATTISDFLKRIRVLFPDAVGSEFTDTCKRLSQEGLVSLRQFDREGFHDYRDSHDDAAFFDTSDGFYLCIIAGSRKYFQQLSALIDVPSTAVRRSA